MTDMTVAKTILAQLGGNRFIAMTGSKNFVGGENTLGFKLGSNPKRITHVRITLDEAHDLYIVEFMKWNGRTAEMKVVSKHEGIYFDMFEDLFLENTGLYCRL